MTGEEERAAIVAWLREEARETMFPEEARALRFAAEQIEAGNHLTNQKDDE